MKLKRFSSIIASLQPVRAIALAARTFYSCDELLVIILTRSCFLYATEQLIYRDFTSVQNRSRS